MDAGFRNPSPFLKLATLLLVCITGACQPSTGSSTVPETEPAAAVVTATSVSFLDLAQGMARALSDRELAGQLIMTGVDGAGSIPGLSRQLLADLLPGAVLLFGYNIPSNPLDLGLLEEDLRQLVPMGSLMPFIAVDHEGGSVFRFKSGLTRLPSARVIAKGGIEAARLAGRISGTELASVGISMNLAPVFEAMDPHNAAFLEARSWSEDPETAAVLADAFASACQASGVAAVAKHFPGNASVDPHVGLPVLDITLEDLESRYLPPFVRAVHGGIAAIMLSHVLVPAVDPEFPVTLSSEAVGLLRNRLGFEGIIMSDDLAMTAISGARSPEAASIVALSAGVDLIMVSGTRQAIKVRDAILRALETGQLDREALVGSAARIMAQKLRFFLHRNEPDEREARRAGLEALVVNNRQALASILGR